MKKCYLLSLAVGLLACSEPIPTYYINPELAHHVAEFVAQARAHGVEITTETLTIDFKDLNGESAGLSAIGKHLILVDSSSLQWKSNPEWVVFHEMGHSYLQRPHDDESVFTGFVTLPKPKSIMHSQVVLPYGDQRAVYLDELF